MELSEKKLNSYVAAVLREYFDRGGVEAEDIVNVYEQGWYQGGCDTCWWPGYLEVAYWYHEEKMTEQFNWGIGVNDVENYWETGVLDSE